MSQLNMTSAGDVVMNVSDPINGASGRSGSQSRRHSDYQTPLDKGFCSEHPGDDVYIVCSTSCNRYRRRDRIQKCSEKVAEVKCGCNEKTKLIGIMSYEVS